MATPAPTIIIGIDPGLTGALAVIALRDATPSLLSLHDLPVERDHRRLDATLLHALLASLPPPTLVVTETLFPPRNTRTAMSLGDTTGVIRAVCAVRGLTLAEVRPADWKRLAGLSTDKSESVALARRLHPELCDKRLRHDKAEAVLLAHYGKLLI